MIKRSFSVVMLALMVAPTYAVYGEGDMPKAPQAVVEVVEKAVSKIREVVGLDSKAPAEPFVEASEMEEETAPSEEGTPSADESENTVVTEEQTANQTPEQTEVNSQNEEVKPGFISRCTKSVVDGAVSSKKAVVAGVSAVTAGVVAGASKLFNAGAKTGKFVVSTVDPRTYVDAGVDLFSGREGVSRFAIIQGHKAAVVGIVGATLASVGFVYREEIVNCGKKLYNWSAAQVQSLRNYIQG